MSGILTFRAVAFVLPWPPSINYNSILMASMASVQADTLKMDIAAAKESHQKTAKCKSPPPCTVLNFTQGLQGVYIIGNSIYGHTCLYIAIYGHI